MINAVIFDLDGVLIDSEPLHCTADSQLLKTLGADAPEKYFDRFAGWTDDLMWGAIKQDYQISDSVESIKKLQVPIKLKLLQEGNFKPISGVVELLDGIKSRHLPMAVASSSPRLFIEAVIRKIGLEHYFEFLLSGQDVEHSKPEPDIFLKAAELLNINPSVCLVVEDSKSGTIAAKKGGMKCIGYRNLNSGDQDLSAADIIVDDIKEITARQLIDKL